LIPSEFLKLHPHHLPNTDLYTYFKKLNSVPMQSALFSFQLQASHPECLKCTFCGARIKIVGNVRYSHAGYFVPFGCQRLKPLKAFGPRDLIASIGTTKPGSVAKLLVISYLCSAHQSMSWFDRWILKEMTLAQLAFWQSLRSHLVSHLQTTDTREWLSLLFCSTRWRHRRFFAELTVGLGVASSNQRSRGCLLKLCFPKCIAQFSIWQFKEGLLSHLFFWEDNWKWMPYFIMI
jgi:hypothetical protein